MQFKASQRLRNPNEEHLNFEERTDTVDPSLGQVNRLPPTAGQDILQKSQLKGNESANTVPPSQPNHPSRSVDILQQPVHHAIVDSRFIAFFKIFEK
uniref:Uncharacterized protein n=1 Tax=Panagrolaimus superbus TaxID=310955 RepID=A0A914YZH6_9BILA